MNAVEIEEAVSVLVEAPFDAEEFSYQFLAAFGNKATTIKRLRSGSTNKSDVAGGVLQRNNIHIAVCDAGTVEATLPAVRDSTATASQKAKYILATDGKSVEAENMENGETLACEYAELADHFGFFLTLAGITTVKQIRENAFDIKATSRLNKLYVELLKENPEWEERREELNHFFARLIFCFFAEDTNIFQSDDQFTGAIEQMAASDSSNTHEIIAELFRAMNTKQDEREKAKIKRWANEFPYVNGGLFSGSLDVPRFSKIARSYLIHIGHLDWTKINPDIFGSMIQAVAEDEERGELGMHYTSVPNILKVLNPLFLDELREKLEEAGDGSDQGSKRKLLNLRTRMARIRVFDPACGSGNFLVIAYKEMRAIEAEVNKRRGEKDRSSEIPLTNFRGIELRHFAAEIARLALIIAEYQCDVLYRGPKLALAEFLPLEAANWIVHGNALRLSWLDACPPCGTNVQVAGTALFQPPNSVAEIEFENQGGETFICSNPPYYGSRRQQADQKSDLKDLLSDKVKKWKSLDYVAGWIAKASEYARREPCCYAFVCTSSVAEGLQVGLIWPLALGDHSKIFFGHRPFKWTNLAANNAGVTVVVVGVCHKALSKACRIFDGEESRSVQEINAYLTPGPPTYVYTSPDPISDLPKMTMGSMPRDGGNLILSRTERDEIREHAPNDKDWIRQYVGTDELVKGKLRYCIWLEDNDANQAAAIPIIGERLDRVRLMRTESTLKSTNDYADKPHRFVYLAGTSSRSTAVIGRVSSERREYLPADMLGSDAVVNDSAFAIYDPPVWALSLILSRLHMVWISSVCGKLESRLRYSNTLGWNTFPIPTLTTQNKDDMTGSVDEILLARESYWPAAISDMYDPDRLDSEFPALRLAHKRNDSLIDRIYVGRQFSNDTERLEKLFELYAKSTRGKTAKKSQGKQGAEA